MIHYPAPPIPQEISDKIEILVRSGMPQQQVIQAMRLEGLNIIDCMKLTSLFYEVEMNQAKQIVHYSDAWADMREDYDAFHERVWEAAKLAGFEEVEESVELRSAS